MSSEKDFRSHPAMFVSKETPIISKPQEQVAGSSAEETIKQWRDAVMAKAENGMMAKKDLITPLILLSGLTFNYLEIIEEITRKLQIIPEIQEDYEIQVWSTKENRSVTRQIRAWNAGQTSAFVGTVYFFNEEKKERSRQRLLERNPSTALLGEATLRAAALSHALLTGEGSSSIDLSILQKLQKKATKNDKFYKEIFNLKKSEREKTLSRLKSN